MFKNSLEDTYTQALDAHRHASIKTHSHCQTTKLETVSEEIDF